MFRLRLFCSRHNLDFFDIEVIINDKCYFGKDSYADFCSRMGRKLFAAPLAERWSVMNEVESVCSTLSECPAAAGLWVINAGYITGAGESHYHWFPDYVCPHILSRGEGVVRTPAGEHQLKPGDMFTLWPGVDIEYYQNPDNPWLVHFIHLAGPQATAFGRECGFASDRAFLQPERPVEVVRDFIAIYDLLRTGDCPGNYEAQAVLYRLIGHCREARQLRGTRSEGFTKLVKRARLLIEVKLDAGLNVNVLAEMLRVGRTSLFNAFRAELGISPIQYLTRCRLERAKHLLLEDRYPLAQIAELSGYRDVHYFRKRFEFEERMTPAAWLAKQLQNNGLPPAL
ncbi:MAG: AraC family transcriptional regulator [Victivallaceae bacterium]